MRIPETWRRPRVVAALLSGVALVGAAMLAWGLGGRVREPGPTPRLASALGVPAVSPLAAVNQGRRVPWPDAQGRIAIPVADRVPARLPAEGTPGGWELVEFAGRPLVELVRDQGRLAIRLRSNGASFALHRNVIVDLGEFPRLVWWWKVRSLPGGGDVRGPTTDDQAAQVYVAFPRWPAPLTSSDVLGYVWDTRAPVGTRLVSPKAPNVRIIVVASGSAGLETWQRQQRDVAADYAAAFGRRPPRVGLVAVMTDANDTRGAAEALFGEIAFSRAPE